MSANLVPLEPSEKLCTFPGEHGSADQLNMSAQASMLGLQVLMRFDVAVWVAVHCAVMRRVALGATGGRSEV